MMKNKEELKDIKQKTAELTEEELEHVNGGLGKLSNGMTINSSADDPNGFQISERMRFQIHDN